MQFSKTSRAPCFIFNCLVVIGAATAHAAHRTPEWMQQYITPTSSAGKSLLMPETNIPAAFIISHTIFEGEDGLPDNYSIPTMLNICQETALTDRIPFLIFPESRNTELLKSMLID